jgi:uncharacterized membrane protein
VRLQLPTVAIAAAWPLASHVAALAGRGDLMPWITATAVGGMAMLASAASRRRGARLVGSAVAVLAVALAGLQPAAVLFVPPVAIHFVLAGLFASTLRSGEEAMIARYARLERGGPLEPDLAAYARRLTVLWVALFIVLGAIAAVLAIAGQLTVWSLFVNVIAYAIVLAALVGEHLFRRVRFRHYRHAALPDFLRAVVGGLPPAVDR